MIQSACSKLLVCYKLRPVPPFRQLGAQANVLTIELSRLTAVSFVILKTWLPENSFGMLYRWSDQVNSSWKHAASPAFSECLLVRAATLSIKSPDMSLASHIVALLVIFYGFEVCFVRIRKFRRL